MARGLRTVVPPAGIPQTLEQSLGIFTSVARDEVNVAAEPFFDQREKTALRMIGASDPQGFSEVRGQIKQEAVSRFGFEPFQFQQRADEFIAPAGFNQVIAKTPEEVAVVWSAGPATRALLAVGFEELIVKR